MLDTIPTKPTALSDFSWRQAEFLDKITAAFDALRDVGYFTAQNFRCCTSCALRAIPKAYDNYVFYHEQDHQRLVNGEDRLYLRWAGNGDEIVAVLEHFDLHVTWDKSENKCIEIAVPIEQQKIKKGKNK